MTKPIQLNKLSAVAFKQAVMVVRNQAATSVYYEEFDLTDANTAIIVTHKATGEVTIVPKSNCAYWKPIVTEEPIEG